MHGEIGIAVLNPSVTIESRLEKRTSERASHTGTYHVQAQVDLERTVLPPLPFPINSISPTQLSLGSLTGHDTHDTSPSLTVRRKEDRLR